MEWYIWVFVILPLVVFVYTILESISIIKEIDHTVQRKKEFDLLNTLLGYFKVLIISFIPIYNLFVVYLFMFHREDFKKQMMFEIMRDL